MSATGKTISNKWMVDLANSALKEVNGWPAWKKESFGVSASVKTSEKHPSSGKSSKRVA